MSKVKEKEWVPVFTVQLQDKSLLVFSGDQINQFIRTDKRIYTVFNQNKEPIFRKIFKG